MDKVLIVFSLFLINIGAQADSCMNFVGKFTATDCKSGWPNKMYPDYTYSRLDTSYDESSQSLEMTYHLGQNHFAAKYIADTVEHSGDGVNSGKTYTAGCNQNQLITRRIFTQLKYPFITTLTVQENSIDFVESFEGDDFTRVCTLVPAP